MDGLAEFVRIAAKIPGWTRAEEAETMARLAFEMPDSAVIVEIGAFLGGCSVLLSGARKLRGSGKVHCVDPFDASGDPISVPHYQTILVAFGGRPMLELFEENIRDAGLSDWVEPHPGGAAEVAAQWRTPVDLLFLDGDQSPAGARAAFEAWEPWVKQGGTIALHNSNPRQYEPGHDGHYVLAMRELRPPRFIDRRVVGSITFGRKVTA
jgi:hypothetical protein